MKIAQLILLFTLTSSIFSCTNEKSLQQFIVNQQEKTDVISFDLPASMMALQEDMQTPENVSILKSIKKANILAYKIKTSNKEVYLSNKEQLKRILKQKKYAELMRYGKGSKGAKVHMVGTDESVDELIVFANDDTLGWLLIRIIGTNMQPQKIMQVFNKIDFNTSDFDLSQLKDILAKSHVEVDD